MVTFAVVIDWVLLLITLAILVGRLYVRAKHTYPYMKTQPEQQKHLKQMYPIIPLFVVITFSSLSLLVHYFW